MGGGLLQLVAYGAQDVYLTGNPQITFFKVVYRRHTNFSIESIQQTFNGSAESGKRVTCQISRNGDLVHKVYLQANIEIAEATGTEAEVTNKETAKNTAKSNYDADPTNTSLEAEYQTALEEYTAAVSAAAAKQVNNAGFQLVKQVEVEIGGQMIDRQYGEWMYIWNELTLPAGKKTGFYGMTGESITGNIKGGGDKTTKIFVPLEFWFCRNIGLALPLIALQYHEVKINLTIGTINNANISNIELWADYIFLDTDERRRFAQLSHEYLIEQVQFTGAENLKTGTNKSKLSFNHPVKELVWVNKDTNFADFKPTTGFQLQLNGNDRFAKRDGTYFTHVQPYQHHENIPKDKYIHVYSFALKPEEHQPSGTLNMSRIDTATAIVDIADSDHAGSLHMYAVNYNVLRILSGMGGLAYSN